MAPPSNFPRLLRAAASRRNATPLLNLHRPSPTSFLHSHPPHLPISNPHLLSTSTLRSVHTRATIVLNPFNSRSISNPFNLRILNPHFFSTSASRRVHTRAATLQSYPRLWLYGIAFGCIATGWMVIHKFQEKSVEGLIGTVNEKSELKVRGVLPGLFRKGHSVVVAAFVTGLTADSEYYLSLTEVLAKPENINAAMERNHNIIAHKLKVAEEDKKLKVAEGTEQEAAVDWHTTSSKAMTKSATDPLKTKSEGKVIEIRLNPRLEARMTRSLEKVLVNIQGLSEVMREGNSVFVKVLEKTNTDEIKEDQLDEIVEDKLADSEYKLADSMKVKLGDTEYHISVEVFSKHDEKLKPQEVAAVVAVE